MKVICDDNVEIAEISHKADSYIYGKWGHWLLPVDATFDTKTRSYSHRSMMQFWANLASISSFECSPNGS